MVLVPAPELIYLTGEWDHFLYVGKIAFFGWFLHYFPFMIMGRVTYVHHYVSSFSR
jgi:dolichyl-phosphate-mannose--protein O-mannosyl transferase